MTIRLNFTLLGVLLALSACGDGKNESTTNTTKTSQSDETDGDGTTSVPEPTTAGVTPQTTGDGTTGPGEESTSTMGFITPGDMMTTKECDVWTQDCPAGTKCMPYANDGGGSWNATKCSEIPDNPKQKGDPCTAEAGAVGGIDDCDVGLLCWYFDENDMGSCIDMCKGSPEDPSCPDPGEVCDESNDGVLILCLLSCDPLVQSCPEGQICFWDGIDTFICDFDASGDMGVFGDPCAFINVCDYGLFCAAPEIVPGCENGDGCCNPYCDTTQANDCPGEGQECLPWYGEETPPVGQENVGFCALPI